MVTAFREWPLVISACVAITMATPILHDIPLTSLAEHESTMVREPRAIVKSALRLIGLSPLEALTKGVSSRPNGDVIHRTREANGTDDNNSLGDRKVAPDPGRGNNIRDHSHNETRKSNDTDDNSLGDRKVAPGPRRRINIRARKGKRGEAPKDGGIRVLLLSVIKIIQKIIAAPLTFIQQFSQL